MVKILKRKAKAISPSELVKQINQIGADAEGITLKEYLRKQKVWIKASANYQKTHWVSSLTDNQKYLIVTTQNEPYSYMGMPLSKTNLHSISLYKDHNRQYARWVETMARFKKLKDGIEKPYEPLKKLTEEYQALGRKLRNTILPEQKGVGGIMSLAQAQKITGGLDIWGQSENFRPPPHIQAKGLLHIEEEKLKVSKGEGLNEYMDRNNLKSPVDIAEFFLKTFNNTKKSDYVVDSYENSLALCKAVGVAPLKLFEVLCREIKVSKKKYKEQQLLNMTQAIEEIVNAYEAKKASKSAIKYSDKAFFISNERKEWSKKYNWDWKGYNRFMEQFPKWVKLISARAVKVEHDFDIQNTLEYENKLGK